MPTDADAPATEGSPKADSQGIAEGDAPAASSKAADAAQVAAGVAARGARTAFWATVRTLSERRGLRVAVIGIALILGSFWLGTDSAVALPLLVVGVILLIAGAVGPRMQGRMSLDFGPDGSLFELKAHLAPPGKTAVAGEIVTRSQPQLTAVPAVPEPDPPDAAVIESHGETIELDVERLKRLLALEDAAASAGADAVASSPPANSQRI